MTEGEWLRCDDPRSMLGFGGAGWTDRKLRLFVCACVRGTDWLVRLRGAGETVEAAERRADGSGTADVWRSAGGMIAGAGVGHPQRQHFSNGNVLLGLTHPNARVAAGYTLSWFCGRDAFGRPSGGGGKAACDVLRELSGDPFNPVALDPTWLTSTVVALAGCIYDQRAFDQMPILADALMDAGCDSEPLLRHCRGLRRCRRCGGSGRSTYDHGYWPPPTEPCPDCTAAGWVPLDTPHARGCWVIDAILGKK